MTSSRTRSDLNFALILASLCASAPQAIGVDSCPLSTTPSWVVEGGLSGANVGHCVRPAGDVNGDGYADVIIGAPSHGTFIPNEGPAYVYRGSIGRARATDNCTAADAIVITSDAAATLPLGVTTVTWKATDGQGNTTECRQLVTVLPSKKYCRG